MQVWSLGWGELWSRKWLPTLVFLPRKFHSQRSLAGYSPWGCKESDMTEQKHKNTVPHRGSWWNGQQTEKSGWGRAMWVQIKGPTFPGKSNREPHGEVEKEKLVCCVTQEQFWWRREICNENFLHCFGGICNISLLFNIAHLYFLNFIYFYFWLCWVFITLRGLSLVVESRGYSSVATCRLLIKVTSLVVEHRLQALRLSSCGTWT